MINILKNSKLFSESLKALATPLQKCKALTTLPKIIPKPAEPERPHQTLVPPSPGEITKINSVYQHVNKLAQDERRSRLFAVVMIAGKQFKVTTEDIITVSNVFFPTIGDKIVLEKVLLVGGKDFTVIGKPLVDKKFVRIEATVIEKTVTNDVHRFTYKPRKDNKRWNFHKGLLTHLRINSIDIVGPVPGAPAAK